MSAPTPRGRPWTKGHVTRMLQNERYLGKQIWGQRTFERKPGTNRLVTRDQAREHWHVIDRPELRIVDDDLWQRVVDRRNALKVSYKITSSGLARGRSGLYSSYLLVGLSQCQTCGKGFTIVSTGHGSPRYGCPNSWRNGLRSCDNRLTIRAKVADPIVLQRLSDELLQPALIREITDAVTTEVTTRLRTEPSERRRLDKRRAAVEKKLAHLVAAIEHGIALPAVKAQMSEREAELRAIDDELAALGEVEDVDVTVIPTWAPPSSFGL